MQDAANQVDRRTVLGATLAAAAFGLTGRIAYAQTDPLPSWNEGSTKASIIDFVRAVTTAGSPDFVSAEQRFATFDNDGTLWIEQPMYVQLAFILDRVKALAPMHPEWKAKQPFQAALDNDVRAVGASGEKGLMQIIAVTHSGMTLPG